MEIKIMNESDFSTSVWAGGKTTEMYLYPEGSSYKERNFLFRISSATVEKETSVFTKLDGIHREIVLLRGNMVLQHGQEAPVTIAPYKPYAFEGSWETVSQGCAQDFNLMYQNCRGSIHVITSNGSALFEKIAGMDFFYSPEEDFQINQQLIKRGQLAMITGQRDKVKIDTKSGNPGVIHVSVNIKGEDDSVTTGF
ncbi:MAG: HutD family protein [Lachnospiraceae bacterium]